MYYRICPHCGSALDPCETCDCERERARKTRSQEVKETEGAHYGKHLSKDLPQAATAHK